MSESVRNIIVRDGMDFAEFFVRSYEATDREGRTRYAATWCCVSSYGVFGHHWSHMGEPFAEFVRGIGDDYLLGKISRPVFDEAKFLKWLRREIFTSRCSRQEKLAASRSLRELGRDWSGPALSHMAYADADISRVDAEWGEGDTESWDVQAAMFVQKMWPKFVAELSVPSNSLPTAAVSGGKGLQ